MAGRYQLRELYAERGGVTTHEAVDPLTGLPVLVYRFSSSPNAGLRDLESENIPGLLSIDTSDAEDDKAEVVVAYFKEYEVLSAPLSVPVPTLLLDSARALKDAALAGVVHGDIHPGRFLASRDHVLVEGFGIPWNGEDSIYRAPEGKSSFAGDVYAWAKSVLELSGDSLDGATKTLFTSCLNADPDERPAASELYASLKVKGAEHKPVAPTFADAELTFPVDEAPAKRPVEPPTDAPFDFSAAAPSEEESSPASSPAYAPPPRATAPAAPPKASWDKQWAEVEDGPELMLSDPGERYKVGAAASARTTEAKAKPFVKDLPPGATSRPGEANTGLRPGAIQEYSFDVQPPVDPRRRRLIIMLLLLFVSAAVLAYLAFFWQQRRAAVPAPAASTVGYIVDAAIGPADLPPVDLYVVASPPGSRTPPGALVSRLSPPGRRVALDKAGTWQLQARFEDRASEIVTFQVPQDRSVSFTIPDVPNTPSQP